MNSCEETTREVDRLIAEFNATQGDIELPKPDGQSEEYQRLYGLWEGFGKLSNFFKGLLESESGESWIAERGAI